MTKRNRKSIWKTSGLKLIPITRPYSNRSQMQEMKREAWVSSVNNSREKRPLNGSANWATPKSTLMLNWISESECWKQKRRNWNTNWAKLMQNVNEYLLKSVLLTKERQNNIIPLTVQEHLDLMWSKISNWKLMSKYKMSKESNKHRSGWNKTTSKTASVEPDQTNDQGQRPRRATNMFMRSLLTSIYTRETMICR